MIKSIQPISFQWPTPDPFLFCAHHYDYYPAGNERHGLDAKHFQGRNMGSDFSNKDGFSFYHGEEIPGFPVHPHRGFETITIVRKGYADHADSLGSAGRYGEGDVQWMTAGSGVQHSEMFPLLHQDKENTLELFQIWLNLPSYNKMVPPDFKMLWAEGIPKVIQEKIEVSIISGEYAGVKFYEAPKNSWANDEGNQVTILLVKLEAGAEFKYPSKAGLNRAFYVFEGAGVDLNGTAIASNHMVEIDSQDDVTIKAHGFTEILILDAKPINEPVAKYGPFVMNTREELMQTAHDYQRTEFGGWSWPRRDMYHGGKIERFAKYPDGHIEKP